MALINYSEIDFNKSINKENKIIEFNGSEIQIVPYLSIQDKYDFIMITLQKAFDNGIYNDLKLDMYFDLHLIYMYTNIVFNNEEKTDELALYDVLMQSGLINTVKKNINEKEISNLWHLMKAIEIKLSNYKGSFLTFLIEAINTLPEKAQKAIELLQKIDPNLLKQFSAGPFATLMSEITNDKNSEDLN